MDCFFQRDVVVYIIFMFSIFLGHFLCLYRYKSEMEYSTLKKLSLLNGDAKMTTPTKEQIEKLYKLGTQDWLDFYKAINSPK